MRERECVGHKTYKCHRRRASTHVPNASRPFQEGEPGFCVRIGVPKRRLFSKDRYLEFLEMDAISTT